MIIARRKYSTVVVRYPLGTPTPLPFIVDTKIHQRATFYARDVKRPENEVGVLSCTTSCILQTSPKLIQSPARYGNGECDNKPGHNKKCHLLNVTAPFILPALLLQFTSEKSRESTGIPRCTVTGSLKTVR